MEILSFASLDVLFLILALLIIPGTRYLPTAPLPPPTPGETPTSPRPTQVPSSPFLAVPSPSGRSTPSPSLSPLSSPRYPHLDVPTITLTPDNHNNVKIGGNDQDPPSRPAHKRKSVSFSLSSMDDLNPPAEVGNKKRPPTPFVSGPISPAGSSQVSSPVPVLSLPGSPMDISHSVKVIDSMGVQKSWLMA